jgi:anti-sigma-K factor RskA
MDFAPQIDEEEPVSQAQVSEHATSRDGSQEKLLVNADSREDSARVKVLDQLEKQQETFENP